MIFGWRISLQPPGCRNMTCEAEIGSARLKGARAMARARPRHTKHSLQSLSRPPSSPAGQTF
jgi:hypothetical protein